MLRQISEEMRVNLKDRLRDVRQGVRQFRHDGRPSQRAQSQPPFPIGEIEGLLGHAVSAFDDAMSAAESLVPRSGKQPGLAVARSLSVYFPAERTLAQAGERAFRRDLYYLAQAALARRTIGAAVIHEADLAAVHATMRKRHAARIAALSNPAGPEGRIAAVASLCSALLITLVDHRPIRLADRAPYVFANGNALDRSSQMRALATVTLLCGVATFEGSDAAGSDLLELSDLAVDARLDRIDQACANADADGELTAMFALLLSHLA